MELEARMFKAYAKGDDKIQLKIIPGHFVTSQSHITHYLDMTTMKTRCAEASRIAKLLSARYETTTPVDTIICMDGLEVIGAFLAEELAKAGVLSMNAHKTIYIVTPEFNPKRFFSGSLMLIAIDNDGNIKEARLMQGVTVFAKFRTLKKLEGKNIAVLAADYQELKRMNKLTRQCLLNAYKTFVDFKTQKLSASAYDTSVNVFNMPLFTKIGLMANNLKVNMSKKFN